MSTGLKTFRIYFSHWRHYPWLSAGSFLHGPAFALQAVVAPLFIAKILGQLAAHRPVTANNIWWTALSLFGGMVLWYLADSWFSEKLSLRVGHDLYQANFDKLLSQEYGFFTDTFGGSLVAQANRFVRAYELFHAIFFLEVLGQLCSVLIALGIMTYYSPTIGVIVALAWLASVVIVTNLGIKRMPVRRKAVATETKQTGELADSVTNAVTVKTFAGEQYEAERYAQVNLRRAKAFKQSWDIAIKNNMVIQAMCGILQIIVLFGGIHAVQNGSINLATFLLFEVYILRIIDSVGRASLFVRQFEGLIGDAHEMTELYMRESRVQDPPGAEDFHVKDANVRFINVSFDYSDGDKTAALFKSLNLSVEAGEKVGLVGPSGGGKTTITKLLLRFLDIQSGQIAVDGRDISQVRQDDLRRAIAYVPQEPLMFHRSIMENIRYGKPDSDDTAVFAAAEKAHAEDFIQDLPNGYDTLVGERGIKLSGGQRQRVAIARAILKDAPILILDEATSSLDSESEGLIQTALKELMTNKTALVIAHRLSTIQRMDRIVVLDDGKIVEQGTHRGLLKHKGLYARLWAHQSGGFLEE